MKYDAQRFHFSDDTMMKMLVGLVGTALMLSVQRRHRDLRRP